MAETDTLRTRLEGEIATIIGRKSERPPLVLWCDPESHWYELLKAIAKSGEFELWDDEQHELVLRETAPG